MKVAALLSLSPFTLATDLFDQGLLVCSGSPCHLFACLDVSLFQPSLVGLMYIVVLRVSYFVMS